MEEGTKEDATDDGDEKEVDAVGTFDRERREMRM